MFIDVKPLLSGVSNVITFDYMLDRPEDFDDIHFFEPVHVTGKITNMAGFMTLEAIATVPFMTHCARCFKEVNRVFDHNFTRYVATHLQNDDNDEYILISENKVDIDLVLLEDLIMNFDFVYLCKDDCKGLCPKCGKDLNEGNCDCPTKEIDPRLAILAKLLDK